MTPHRLITAAALLALAGLGLGAQPATGATYFDPSPVASPPR